MGEKVDVERLQELADIIKKDNYNVEDNINGLTNDIKRLISDVRSQYNQYYVKNVADRVEKKLEKIERQSRELSYKKNETVKDLNYAVSLYRETEERIKNSIYKITGSNTSTILGFNNTNAPIAFNNINMGTGINNINEIGNINEYELLSSIFTPYTGKEKNEYNKADIFNNGTGPLLFYQYLAKQKEKNSSNINEIESLNECDEYLGLLQCLLKKAKENDGYIEIEKITEEEQKKLRENIGVLSNDAIISYITKLEIKAGPDLISFEE